MAREKKIGVMILLSGGLDSTTCLAHYRKAGFITQGLFIDYGHKAKLMEKSAVSKIAKYYGIPLRIVEVKGIESHGAGFLLGRNAMFLHMALMALPINTGIIALGIHARTNYVDCSPLFLDIMRQSFNVYTDGCVQIGAPFLKWEKSEIYNYAKELLVPLDLIYSCELGCNPPCGNCPSCRDMEALYAM